MTISGLSFGALSPTPSASATGVEMCSTASWTSGTTVECQISAATAAKTSYTTVTVAAVVGTRVRDHFTFDGTADLVGERKVVAVVVCRECTHSVWGQAVLHSAHWFQTKGPGSVCIMHCRSSQECNACCSALLLLGRAWHHTHVAGRG